MNKYEKELRALLEGLSNEQKITILMDKVLKLKSELVNTVIIYENAVNCNDSLAQKLVDNKLGHLIED